MTALLDPYDGSYMPEEFWLNPRLLRWKRGPRIGSEWVAWIKLTNALGRRNPGAGMWPLRSRLSACLVRPL